MPGRYWSWIAFWAVVAIMAGSRGGGSAELPVEVFFRNFLYDQAQISPSGRYLAALAPIQKRVGVAVVDLEKMEATWAHRDRYADVKWFEWANEDRLLFSLGEGGVLYRGLFSVKRDGTALRTLVPLEDFRTRYLSRLPGRSNEILVTTAAYGARLQTGLVFPNVARINIETGRLRHEVTNPGGVVDWIADHRGVVRIGLATEEDRIKLLHRAGTNAAWETLAAFRADAPAAIWPIAFDYDDRTLFVSHSGPHATEGLYRYDVVTKTLGELCFRHGEADVQSIELSDRKRALLGVRYTTDRPQPLWADADYRQAQVCVDKALPGTLNQIVSGSEDGRKLVILAASDRTPGAYHLLDTTTWTLKRLFDRADWVPPDALAPMKSISFKARDGLVLPGYLTLPPGVEAKGLPLVVYVHGGPWARDTWGFVPEVQFFANRGCAVLQVNFRGSTGYGPAFERAGYRQWGLKMQDDLTDGVRWAIAQGIADPKRVCIAGGSYGGYATLMGLETTPELYRCGIVLAGLTDLVRWLNEHRFSVLRTQFGESSLARMVGDAGEDKARLRELSPLTHADRIQVPVLLAYGELDSRVSIEQGRKLAGKLKANGRLFDFIVKADEAHGFFKEDNRIELWKRVDDLLKASLK